MSRRITQRQIGDAVAELTKGEEGYTEDEAVEAISEVVGYDVDKETVLEALNKASAKPSTRTYFVRTGGVLAAGIAAILAFDQLVYSPSFTEDQIHPENAVCQPYFQTEEDRECLEVIRELDEVYESFESLKQRMVDLNIEQHFATDGFTSPIETYANDAARNIESLSFMLFNIGMEGDASETVNILNYESARNVIQGNHFQNRMREFSANIAALEGLAPPR